MKITATNQPGEAAAQGPVRRAPVAQPHQSAPQTPVKVGKKIGRNDPCPCGSGKKYKNCCGRNTGAGEG